MHKCSMGEGAGPISKTNLYVFGPLTKLIQNFQVELNLMNQRN